MMAIDVEVPELDVGEREFLPTIKKIVSNYVPETRVTVPMKTVIILSDEVPVYQRLRQLAPREKVAVDRQVEEWLSEGIIRHSCSDYASPVVLVAKKDGTLRLCIDYRALNKKLYVTVIRCRSLTSRLISCAMLLYFRRWIYGMVFFTYRWMRTV